MSRETEYFSMTYIERKPNTTMYRVKGKGVTVAFLVDYIDDPEWPVARIAKAYGLTPAEIHAAWAFYYDHQAEIDEARRRNHEFYESLPSYREYFERKQRETNNEERSEER
ncbi:MAG: DUF433 domain-containing protein [Anaerolineae bacterium]|nr:MAG: DUF433 domain-containing protein [Anaerolineae bacterium]